MACQKQLLPEHAFCSLSLRGMSRLQSNLQQAFLARGRSEGNMTDPGEKQLVDLALGRRPRCIHGALSAKPAADRGCRAGDIPRLGIRRGSRRLLLGRLVARPQVRRQLSRRLACLAPGLCRLPGTGYSRSCNGEHSLRMAIDGLFTSVVRQPMNSG